MAAEVPPPIIVRCTKSGEGGEGEGGDEMAGAGALVLMTNSGLLVGSGDAAEEEEEEEDRLRPAIYVSGKLGEGERRRRRRPGGLIMTRSRYRTLITGRSRTEPSCEGLAITRPDGDGWNTSPSLESSSAMSSAVRLRCSEMRVASVAASTKPVPAGSWFIAMSASSADALARTSARRSSR